MSARRAHRGSTTRTVSDPAHRPTGGSGPRSSRSRSRGPRPATRCRRGGAADALRWTTSGRTGSGSPCRQRYPPQRPSDGLRGANMMTPTPMSNGGADDVEAVGPEAIGDDPPRQRSGDEDAPVGGEDPAEVRSSCNVATNPYAEAAIPAPTQTSHVLARPARSATPRRSRDRGTTNRTASWRPTSTTR